MSSMSHRRYAGARQAVVNDFRIANIDDVMSPFSNATTLGFYHQSRFRERNSMQRWHNDRLRTSYWATCCYLK